MTFFKESAKLLRMAGLAVSVDGLVKRFGNVVAVDGVSIEIPVGTVLGLLGPNGAGKTTIVRVLTTVTRPDAGSAHVLGLDVVRQAHLVRSVIGLAGQFAAVDGNLTGRENLRLIGRLTHLRRSDATAQAEALLERFDLVDAADRPVRTYSGGMRRRLDLSAALVHRPPVLFLDEPTTGLDPQSRNELWEVIKELVADGTTVLLTTQYLEEADRLADQIVVIDHGRVIAEGTAAALKRRLGGTVVELDFGRDDVAAGVVSTLAPLAVRPPDRMGSAVHLELLDGAHTLVEVVRALDRQGVEPTKLAVREPSLDDVFLSLTGATTADGSGRGGGA